MIRTSAKKSLLFLTSTNKYIKNRIGLDLASVWPQIGLGLAYTNRKCYVIVIMDKANGNENFRTTCPFLLQKNIGYTKRQLITMKVIGRALFLFDNFLPDDDPEENLHI